MVTDIDYNDATPDVHYEYGEYGERIAMQEKDTGGAVVSTTNYGYDPYKRLLSETRSFWGFAGTYTVVYEYNYVGLTRITVNLLNSYYASGWTRRVNYAYNFAGSVASIGTDLIGFDSEDKTNVANSLLYRGFGGLKSLRYGANPRRLQIGYDVKRQQMTSLVVDLPDGSDAIINRAYDYLNGGANNSRIQRITNAVESDYTATFDYDEHNRLANATAVAWSRRYTYDTWGNLTRVEMTGGTGQTYDLSYATNASGAPATNQIANPGSSYDAAGNQTNNGSQAMTYDAANRLRSALGGETLNDYDGDGRRAKHVQWGAPIYYLWSSVLGEPVLEITSEGKVYRAYVYSPSGQRVALQSWDGKFYWVHTDHLGTAVRLTDSSGAEFYKGEFDPHGQPISEWANPDGETFLTSHKFTGYERDWATMLDYAKARTYQADRGRFLQADPLGLGAADLISPQSLNRYTYVMNDPINLVDPSGTFWRLACGSIDYGYCDESGCYTISQSYCYFYDDGFNTPSVLNPMDPFGTGSQNPAPIPIKEIDQRVVPPNPACDLKLARIFGGQGAVAAGSGYEPTTLLPGFLLGAFRGHLYRFMHVYASAGGTSLQGPVGLYVPRGGKNIRSSDPGEDAYRVQYNKLGNLTNVTLYAYHVANFKPRIEGGRLRIGDIGGSGGNLDPNYVHSHFSIRGAKGEAYSFVDAFCR